ncbi:hypothetical protein JL720_1888 [Aureococcus anophagefferens]|nr:hypothetical protein JL720_1888 [Aureococcus anophagefferens]
MAFAAVATSARDPEDPRDAAAPGRRLLVINALEDGASVDIFYAGARGAAEGSHGFDQSCDVAVRTWMRLLEGVAAPGAGSPRAARVKVRHAASTPNELLVDHWLKADGFWTLREDARGARRRRRRRLRRRRRGGRGGRRGAAGGAAAAARRRRGAGDAGAAGGAAAAGAAAGAGAGPGWDPVAGSAARAARRTTSLQVV